jgi:hypothetical protein
MAHMGQTDGLRERESDSRVLRKMLWRTWDKLMD